MSSQRMKLQGVYWMAACSYTALAMRQLRSVVRISYRHATFSFRGLNLQWPMNSPGGHQVAGCVQLHPFLVSPNLYRLGSSQYCLNSLSLSSGFGNSTASSGIKTLNSTRATKKPVASYPYPSIRNTYTIVFTTASPAFLIRHTYAADFVFQTVFLNRAAIYSKVVSVWAWEQEEKWLIESRRQKTHRGVYHGLAFSRDRHFQTTALRSPFLSSKFSIQNRPSSLCAGLAYKAFYSILALRSATPPFPLLNSSCNFTNQSQACTSFGFSLMRRVQSLLTCIAFSSSFADTPSGYRPAWLYPSQWKYLSELISSCRGLEVCWLITRFSSVTSCLAFLRVPSHPIMPYQWRRYRGISLSMGPYWQSLCYGKRMTSTCNAPSPNFTPSQKRLLSLYSTVLPYSKSPYLTNSYSLRLPYTASTNYLLSLFSFFSFFSFFTFFSFFSFFSFFYFFYFFQPLSFLCLCLCSLYQGVFQSSDEEDWRAGTTMGCPPIVKSSFNSSLSSFWGRMVCPKLKCCMIYYKTEGLPPCFPAAVT